LEYAIKSQELYFNESQSSEYKQKINQIAIDAYPNAKSEIVERILVDCDDIGLLVECGRMDLVDKIVKTKEQIEYCISIGVVRESFLSISRNDEELRVRLMILLGHPIDTPLPLSLSLKYTPSANLNLLTRLRQEFLFRNQHTDFTLLKQLKLDSKHSILHQSMNILHSLSTLGTTNDSFLRDNIEWLSRANNWSRFFATSQLGMIHCMNIDNYKQVLSAYMPGVGKSKYVEGGSLYGYGMCSSSSSDDYLSKLIDTELDEIVYHGLLLGLGCQYVNSSNSNTSIDRIKHLLYLDSATIGESSGICLGMIKYQSKDESLLLELRDYLRETQHEKIQRGLAIGIGLIGSNSSSSSYNDMIKSEISIERYAGVLGLGVGNSNSSSSQNTNTTLQSLLHTIVSDSDDDVRRIATICVGLVLRNQIDHLLITMKLLIDSYNPSVRYGACIALSVGVISNRDTIHMKEILSLLEKTLSDSVDFVRQGAFIAIGIVCQLGCDENSLRLRQLAIDAIKKKHEDHLVKLGACICIGFMDMAGRNGIVSIDSDEGLIGFVLFLHYWWWFPLLQMIYMCVDVQMVVLIDEDGRLLDKSVEYECRGYVEAVKEEVKVSKKKDYVELSVSKGGDKSSGDKKEKESSDMEVDTTTTTNQKKSTPPATTTPPTTTKTISNNFARIFKGQKYSIDGKEYVGQGVVVMEGDGKYLEFSTPKVVSEGESGDVKPPEEFEYTE